MKAKPMPFTPEQRAALSRMMRRQTYTPRIDDMMTDEGLAYAIAQQHHEETVVTEQEDTWFTFEPSYPQRKPLNRRGIADYLAIQLAKLREADNLPETEYQERIVTVYRDLNRFYYSQI